MEINFKRHLTTHLYELWPKVKRTEEKQQCKKIGCEKQFSNWKFSITHLATVHGELTNKLEEREETLGVKVRSTNILCPDMSSLNGKEVMVVENGTPAHFYCKMVDSDDTVMEELLADAEDTEVINPTEGYGVLVRIEG